jgi:hypothetical protein
VERDVISGCRGTGSPATKTFDHFESMAYIFLELNILADIYYELIKARSCDLGLKSIKNIVLSSKSSSIFGN